MAISQRTTIQAYQLKAGGTRARMAILRMIAADSVNNYNESTRLAPGDWRGARRWTMYGYESAYSNGLDQGFNGREGNKTPVWYSHGGEQFRNERDANDIVHSLDNGWFTDSDQSETAIGIVASLPHGRFIAGYRWTSNDERVYFPDVHDDENDAARMADEHARVFAESAREDSERFDAMQNAEEVTYVCARLRKYLPARNVTVTLREEVRSIIEELRDARNTLVAATASYEKA